MEAGGGMTAAILLEKPEIRDLALRATKRLINPHNQYYRNQYPSVLEWRKSAREKQLPPCADHPLPSLRRDDWFVWFIRSGRGFGKTWVGSNWTIEKVATNPGCVIALIGQTALDVRQTMIEINPSSILKQSPVDFKPLYEPSKRQLTWPNGSIGLLYYGDEPDQLRGPQPHFAWVDELAKFKYADDLWDQLEMVMRSGDKPEVLVTTTPRAIPIVKTILKDSETVDVVGSTYENEANLAPKFLKRILKKYEGTRLGRQELRGEILDDAPGALWKREQIEADRCTEMPTLVRIVVAVDPAPTSTDESDDTGIVVAGLGEDGHGYILAAKSVHDVPNVWAKEAISLYSAHHADRIIGEKNNGGDLIETIIRAINKTVSYGSVWASRGKTTRAEPVAALSEKHEIHHVGTFPDLEDQLCQWEQGMKSPDLLDAMVWAITELMLPDEQEEDKTINYLPFNPFFGRRG